MIVKRAFVDKHTGTRYVVGKPFEGNAERVRQLLDGGYLEQPAEQVQSAKIPEPEVRPKQTRKRKGNR